jgi:hypothetical protein
MSVSGECCLTSEVMCAAGERTPVEVSTGGQCQVYACCRSTQILDTAVGLLYLDQGPPREMTGKESR